MATGSSVDPSPEVCEPLGVGESCEGLSGAFWSQSQSALQRAQAPRSELQTDGNLGSQRTQPRRETRADSCHTGMRAAGWGRGCVWSVPSTLLAHYEPGAPRKWGSWRG